MIGLSEGGINQLIYLPRLCNMMPCAIDKVYWFRSVKNHILFSIKACSLICGSSTAAFTYLFLKFIPQKQYSQ